MFGFIQSFMCSYIRKRNHSVSQPPPHYVSLFLSPHPLPLYPCIFLYHWIKSAESTILGKKKYKHAMYFFINISQVSTFN